jgi:hypothetical protein
MLHELRFDELDLREEPARGSASDHAAMYPTTYTWECTNSAKCTHLCCTPPQYPPTTG